MTVYTNKAVGANHNQLNDDRRSDGASGVGGTYITAGGSSNRAVTDGNGDSDDGSEIHPLRLPPLVTTMQSLISHIAGSFFGSHQVSYAGGAVNLDRCVCART